MANPTDPTVESWVKPLEKLVIQWIKLQPNGYSAFLSTLCQHLRAANCYPLISWLIMEGPLPDLTEDAKRVAPRAVLRALERVYDDTSEPPTEQQRQELCELRELRDAAAQAARNALNPQPQVVWQGDDWDELDPLVRKLLLYMSEKRDVADLRDLCPRVWGKDYADVSSPARETVTSKANKFLKKRQSKRMIEKVKDEPFLRWV